MLDWFDKIEDYLENRLPPAEKTEFEKAMNSDPDLAAETELWRLEISAGELLVEKKLRSKVSLWEHERQKKLQKKPANWLKMMLVGAGTVLLFLALFWWLIQPGEKQMDNPKPTENQPVATEQPRQPESPIAEKKAENDSRTTANTTPSAAHRYLAAAERLYAVPMLSPVRGSEKNGAEHPFNRALMLFQNNDFEAAAQVLASPEAAWFESGVFLRGHAFFRAGKFERAAADFKLLLERNSLIYAEEAHWNLALCYLALMPKSKPELEKLLADVRGESTAAEIEKYAEIERLLR